MNTVHEPSDAAITTGLGDEPAEVDIASPAQADPTPAPEATQPPGDEPEVSQSDTGEEEPRLLAGKYKTQEELEKAHLELQKKLGARGEDKPLSLEPAPEIKTAGDIVKKVGLDPEALKAKFLDKGELDAEDYAAFEKAGYPRDAVDDAWQGQLSRVVQRDNAALQSAGLTREQMTEAGRHLSETDPERYKTLAADVQKGGDAQRAALLELRILHGQIAADTPALPTDRAGAFGGGRKTGESEAIKAFDEATRKGELPSDEAFNALGVDKVRTFNMGGGS